MCKVILLTPEFQSKGTLLWITLNYLGINLKENQSNEIIATLQIFIISLNCHILNHNLEHHAIVFYLSQIKKYYCKNNLRNLFNDKWRIDILYGFVNTFINQIH